MSEQVKCILKKWVCLFLISSLCLFLNNFIIYAAESKSTKEKICELMKIANGNDYYARYEAVKTLGGMVPDTFDSLCEIALSSEDTNIVTNATTYLGKCGEHAVPILSTLLNHQNVEVRNHAIKTLGDMGVSAKSAIPSLIMLLENHDGPYGAKAALIKINGDIKTTLMQNWATENKPVKIKVLQYLGDYYLDHEDVLEVFNQALNGDDDFKYQAAFYIGKLGTRGNKYVKAFIEILSLSKKEFNQTIEKTGVVEVTSKHFRMIMAVVESLGEIGPDAKTALPTLFEIIKSDVRDEMKLKIMIAIRKIGIKDENDIKLMIDELNGSRSDAYQSMVLKILGDVEQPHTSITKIITDAVRNSNGKVKLSAIEAIGKSPYSEDSMKVVLENLQNPDEIVREYSIAALGNMGTKNIQVTSNLLEVMSENNPEMQTSIIEAMGYMGKNAEPAVLKLLEIASQQTKNCHLALWALGKTGTQTDRVILQLGSWLEQENIPLKVVVLKALGDIGPAARLVGPQVIKCLNHGNAIIRSTAAVSLGKMKIDSDESIEGLARLLEDPHRNVQQTAVWALARFSSKASKVVPVLLSVLNRNESEAHIYAIFALGEMRAEAVPALAMIASRYDARHVDERMSCIISMAKISPNSPLTIETIHKALNDEDLSVREKAKAIITSLNI